jgi:hypothetical protein
MSKNEDIVVAEVWAVTAAVITGSLVTIVALWPSCGALPAPPTTPSSEPTIEQTMSPPENPPCNPRCTYTEVAPPFVMPVGKTIHKDDADIVYQRAFALKVRGLRITDLPATTETFMAPEANR